VIALLFILALGSPAHAEDLKGEITVSEDVTIRVKPGTNELEKNPLNLVLDGTVDFLVNLVTW
jgi:hypothetical protein